MPRYWDFPFFSRKMRNGYSQFRVSLCPMGGLTAIKTCLMLLATAKIWTPTVWNTHGSLTVDLRVNPLLQRAQM